MSDQFGLWRDFYDFIALGLEWLNTPITIYGVTFSWFDAAVYTLLGYTMIHFVNHFFE